MRIASELCTLIRRESWRGRARLLPYLALAAASLAARVVIFACFLGLGGLVAAQAAAGGLLSWAIGLALRGLRLADSSCERASAWTAAAMERTSGREPAARSSPAP